MLNLDNTIWGLGSESLGDLQIIEILVGFLGMQRIMSIKTHSEEAEMLKLGKGNF